MKFQPTENSEISRAGDILTIKVDLSKPDGRLTSGGNIRVCYFQTTVHEERDGAVVPTPIWVQVSVIDKDKDKSRTGRAWDDGEE